MMDALFDRRVLLLTGWFALANLILFAVALALVAAAYLIGCIPCIFFPVLILGVSLHWLYALYASSCTYLLVVEKAGTLEAVRRILSFPAQLLFAAPIMAIASLKLWWRLLKSGKQGPMRMRIAFFSDFSSMSHSLLIPIMAIENKTRAEAEDRMAQVLIENYERLRKVSFMFRYAIPIVIAVFLFGMFVLMAIGSLSQDIRIPGFMPSPLFLLLLLIPLFAYASALAKVSSFAESYMETLYRERVGGGAGHGT